MASMSTALDFRLRKRNETFQTKVEQVCDVSSGDAPPSATPVRTPNQMKITVSDALFATAKSSFTECLIFRGVFDEDLATPCATASWPTLHFSKRPPIRTFRLVALIMHQILIKITSFLNSFHSPRY
jgi:hypothetical protein